jgi:adenylosuccinate lyase
MAMNADSTLDLQRQITAMKSQIGSPVFDTYQTSLTGRYCSKEMSQLFSQRSRHSTWRKLWLYLAEAEKELGIDTISDEALEEMREHLTVTDEDFEIARVEEKKRRHDVMAHVHAFGQVAPKAAGIIHYGVSVLSECCDVKDGEVHVTCENRDSSLSTISKRLSTNSVYRPPPAM